MRLLVTCGGASCVGDNFPEVLYASSSGGVLSYIPNAGLADGVVTLANTPVVVDSSSTLQSPVRLAAGDFRGTSFNDVLVIDNSANIYWYINLLKRYTSW